MKGRDYGILTQEKMIFLAGKIVLRLLAKDETLMETGQLQKHFKKYKFKDKRQL